jgi:hypothetical protein
MKQEPTTNLAATVRTAALGGGAIGGCAGFILAIVAAILRGPIPAAVVIAAMGAVLLTIAGTFCGALAGAALGSIYRAAQVALAAWAGQVPASTPQAIPIQQQTGRPAHSG